MIVKLIITKCQLIKVQCQFRVITGEIETLRFQRQEMRNKNILRKLRRYLKITELTKNNRFRLFPSKIAELSADLYTSNKQAF